MRTIKFRGKRVDNGEWVYGFYWASICPTKVDTEYRAHFISEGVSIKPFTEVTPESVGQFTGLKDKNGKDIYEGDVCAMHYFTRELGENLGVREGESEIQGTINIRPLGLFVDNEPVMMYFDNEREHSEDHFEIIGNIHEQ